MDQHIFQKSAVLEIGQSEVLTEQEINVRLRTWCQIAQVKGVDYVTLRRRLVSTGYLARSNDGFAYQETQPDQVNMSLRVPSI